MGNPVRHSKSPQIHAAFARQTGQNIHYHAILVAEGKFPDALAAFQAQGGKGLNITVPFKHDAWEVADHLSEKAKRAHAVNTLWFDNNGKRHGDTTDGVGLIRDLVNNHGISLAGETVLVLGAGGAVRGILDPLFDQNPARVVIVNRTLTRAEGLADAFSDRGVVTACSYEDLSGQQFRFVINGTAASLHGEVPPLPDDLLGKDAFCYDLMYANTDTVFIEWAQSHGTVRAHDGLGMLVEQAAESFFIWRGIRPETAPVIDMLRKG
jgi:shikimate dehydrogenase